MAGCSSSKASGRPLAFCVTQMFTTAGKTFLTKGAKLCCCISATGEVIVCGAGDGGA